jgi:TetR/AcrR family transcriptional regulator
MEIDDRKLLDHRNAERLLDEAWLLFQEKGYRGLNLDVLCERCQLSKPTLYYYFKDKENLFVQVLIHKLEKLQAATRVSGELDLRLESVAAAILSGFQSEYSLLLHDRTHIRRPENRQRIHAAFHAGLFGPLEAMMAEGVNSGRLRAESPRTLTLVFLGVLNNFIGRAAEMGLDHPALARKLTHYFLEGAKQ